MFPQANPKQELRFNFKASEAHLTIVIGFCLFWLSQLWIASHIWFPKLERLAKNER
jgi:hypothetical protein